MARPTAFDASPVSLIAACWRHWPIWCAATAISTVLAGLYIVLVPADWQATQTLVVRNEAVNNQDGPGRFRQENEMKTTQETILEVAHSRGVAEAVPETSEASLQLGEAVLVEAGVPMGLAIAAIHERRDALRRLLGRPDRRKEVGKARARLKKLRQKEKS